MKLRPLVLASLVLPVSLACFACGGESGATDEASGGEASTGGSTSSGGGSSTGGSGIKPGDFEGTVTFDGTTLDCEVDVDTFTSGEYSVICDNDELSSNYRYVEVTFKDEAAARTAQSLVLVGPFDFTGGHEDPTTISVGWTDANGTLYSADDSAGTASVRAEGDHFVLELVSVVVASNSTETTGTLSASLPF